MGKINIMSEDLANKIAAGEVVEKTMNVVKELVENSIDAKSTEIKINLIDSGVKEIQVIDNGIGMDKDDAVLAFSRHATSKLKTLEDLFYIDSLGFRGEALPSIASVSHVKLKTCNGEVGTEVDIDGGVINEVKPSELKKGTSVTVSELFYNTPVRLKYLKNLYTELANIVDYVNRMALSFPNIRFVLTNNEKTLLNTDGRGSLLKVIGNIYGMELTKKMIPINSSNDDYEINGFVCYPECARSSKNNIIILVNGRTIRNSEINKTIIESYHTYIPDSKFPIAILNIQADPILIDVNIHPTKMDIKFSKIDTLKLLISSSVKEKLEKLNLIPEISIKNNYPQEEVPLYNYQDAKEEVKTQELVLNLDDDKDKNTLIVSDKEEIYNEAINTCNSVEETNQTEDKNIESDVRIKKMYPIGVIHATFIVAQNEDGMYLIDQHACAERINYEKYLDILSKHDNTSIELLVPIKLELANKDYIILKENLNILIDLGFTIEDFGTNTILIRRHPVWIPSKFVEDSIRNIIEIVIGTEQFDYTKFIDRLAAMCACKHSIRAGEYMSMSDIEDMLERIRHVKNPFNCAHGRPTIISYSNYELDKMFKRVMN